MGIGVVELGRSILLDQSVQADMKHIGSGD